MPTPAFIPGLDLARLFFQDVVEPILRQSFPSMRYSAGLIGEGSEVLGYDDVMSTDHCWGPRCMLFVEPEEYRAQGENIRTAIISQMPSEFLGYSTQMECPVKDTINVFTVGGFCESHLGTDATKGQTSMDWLGLPSQKLLELTSGRLFCDDVGLGDLRKNLAYYPHDVWLYMLACQWTRIGQEEAFPGRAGESGDELGSQIVAARLVRELMKLVFLLERRYAPYSKWFGRAFSTLSLGKELGPRLSAALCSTNWKDRESELSRALETVASFQNVLQIAPAVPAKVSNYFDRPFLVIHADECAKALRSAIRDPAILAIRENMGAVDQFVDSTDVLSYPDVFKKLKPWGSTSA